MLGILPPSHCAQPPQALRHTAYLCTLYLIAFASPYRHRLERIASRAYVNIMTTALFTLASLAPAIANAVALLRATPEPTHFVPSMDIWNPAPTAAAQLPLSLFKRQASGHDYTCGFVSGSPGRSSSPTQSYQLTHFKKRQPSNMRKPDSDMRNKHLLRHPRLLRPSVKHPLHTPHFLHRIHRYDRLMHRHRLLI